MPLPPATYTPVTRLNQKTGFYLPLPPATYTPSPVTRLNQRTDLYLPLPNYTLSSVPLFLFSFVLNPSQIKRCFFSKPAPATSSHENSAEESAKGGWRDGRRDDTWPDPPPELLSNNSRLVHVSLFSRVFLFFSPRTSPPHPP